jgi:hypothetical protein
MDKIQKTAFTEYNAPSSEPFRLHCICSLDMTCAVFGDISEHLQREDAADHGKLQFYMFLMTQERTAGLFDVMWQLN